MEFITALSQQQVEELHQLYQNELWSKGRTLDETRRCVEGSQLCFGIVDDDGNLQAFSRVVTDYIFKAFVFDVIVAPGSRNLRLGHQLMETIKSHPSLKEVKHFELYCLPELKGYYQQFGFTDDVSGMGLMRCVAR